MNEQKELQQEQAEEIQQNNADEVTSAAPMGDAQTESNNNLSAELEQYIQQKIDEGIKEGIKKALKGKTPKADMTAPTDEQRKIFNRMNYKERLNLKLSNPHTYYALAKGEK